MKNNIAKTIRIQKLQNKNRMVGQSFSTLGNNERRRTPWLGSVWFEKGRDEERKKFIEDWQKETERMLKINPELKIVG